MPLLSSIQDRARAARLRQSRIASNLAGERMIRALARLGTLVGKAGFNEDQPRVPGGNGRDSGRWRYVEGYAQSRQPGIGDNGGPSLDPPKDPTKDRSPKIKAAKALAKAIARQALRRAGPIGAVVTAIEAGHWLYTEWPSIRSYQDQPKSLEELKEQAGKKRPGYDDHHIVEQGAGGREGFPRSGIDGVDNVVSIPRYKHHEITGWYSRPNLEFGMQAPRDYLLGRDWSEHVRVGHQALRQFKVLK
ncbi:hypothetical protein GGC47_000733 [Bosea sp. OAE752]|uniref:hypothetical protein n=2 Tax=unclassified Bosea (in: a-proteobacteria) TaxID=2653178 RepID=UPI003D19DB71